MKATKRINFLRALLVILLLSPNKFALFLYGQGCSFNLGNDTSFCAGTPINLPINGPAAYNSYLWNTGQTTQNINATAAGVYTCTATLLGADLIVNGDFSSGNSGFTSSYIYSPGDVWGESTYDVITNPLFSHPFFASFGDHTTGSGNMMVVNGAVAPGAVIWSETITVSPNANYNFSAWVASCTGGSVADLAQLQFSINGVLVGPIFSAPLTLGVWQQFFANWNSGTSTSAVISIVDQNTFGLNDFALDDIFFQNSCTYTDTLVVSTQPLPVAAITTVSDTCSQSLGAASVAVTGGSGTYSYLWSNGAVTPSINNVLQGTYTVTVNDGGCSATASATVPDQSLVPSVTTISDTCGQGLGAASVAVTSGSGTYSYLWSNGATTSTIYNVPSGTYTVTVSEGGCSVTASGTVADIPPPIANFTYLSNELSANNTMVNFTDQSTNANAWQWAFGDGAASSLTNPSHDYSLPGDFEITLIVTNAFGCADTAYSHLVIPELSTFYIPNAFTPNENGLNDSFGPVYTNVSTEDYDFKIYNRWGELVFQTIDLDKIGMASIKMWSLNRMYLYGKWSLKIFTA